MATDYLYYDADDKPLTNAQPGPEEKFARAIERAHGIGAPPCATGDCIPSKCNICEVKE